MEKRCIYCGSRTDLSISDIIPDALTNVKIRNKNVCKIKHNNEFSGLFESQVIHELAPISNFLNIKTRSGYTKYDCNLNVNGQKFSAKLGSEKDISHNLFKSQNQKFLCGTRSNLKVIKGKFEEFPLEKVRVEININPSIFYAKPMYRLISKIAFEWYVKEKGINGYDYNYDNIINYIVEGKGNPRINIITDESIYRLLNSITSVGSHTLLTFKSINNEDVVIVSLFGLLMYRVVIGDTINDKQSKIIYKELKVDKSVEAVSLPMDEFNNTNINIYINKNSYEKSSEERIEDKVCLNIEKSDINQNERICPNLFRIVEQLNGVYLNDDGLQLLDTKKREIYRILKNNLDEIFSTVFLNKFAIDRFVSENFKTFDEETLSDLKDIRMTDTIYLYILYRIGINSIGKNGSNPLEKSFLDYCKIKHKSINNEDLTRLLKDEMAMGYPKNIREGIDFVKNKSDKF